MCSVLRLGAHVITLGDVLGLDDLGNATVWYESNALIAVRAEVVHILEPVQQTRQTCGAYADDTDANACHDGHARTVRIDSGRSPETAVRAVYDGGRLPEEMQGGGMHHVLSWMLLMLIFMDAICLMNWLRCCGIHRWLAFWVGLGVHCCLSLLPELVVK